MTRRNHATASVACVWRQVFAVGMAPPWLEGDEVFGSAAAAAGVEPVPRQARGALNKNVAGFGGEHVEAGCGAAGCAGEPDAARGISGGVELHRVSTASRGGR
jgi:hypothetical protein